MSEIGLIERSTISGLIDEVKRLRGTDEPLTPKQALFAVSEVSPGGVNSDEVVEILEEYLNENLDEHLDGYFEENPPIAKITINGEGPDENGNFNIECGSADANNVVEF